MNGLDFIRAVKALAKERGISEDEIFEYMETALHAAFKKNNNATNSKVKIDRKTGEIKVVAYKVVVDEINMEDEEDAQILLEELGDNPNHLKVGDVITFRSSNPTNINMTVTHRIKAITKDSDGNACYVTKGDANPIEDEVCAKYKNVIGKVIIRIPGVGHIQRFLASGIGWMLFILIPALIIIGKDIMKITKLSSIKENASKMTDKKRKDPKKEAAEKKRKEEIKRKLLNENKGTKEYYRDPTIKIIEKKKTKKENDKQKRKKK